MNWYYSKDGQPAGPVEEEEFERLVASGAIRGATLVWHNGLADWKPYAEVRPAGAPPPLHTPAAPDLSGDRRLTAASAPGTADLPALPYAGFWIRVAASFFDSLILLPVFSLLLIGFFVAFPDFLAGDASGTREREFFNVVVLAIGATYETLFVGRFGATPGKMICNLRILHPDGAGISYGRALARYFCKGLSSLFFFVGYLAVAVTPQKCGLHDFICDTRVIHTD